jgi:hypothetical protein
MQSSTAKQHVTSFLRCVTLPARSCTVLGVAHSTALYQLQCTNCHAMLTLTFGNEQPAATAVAMCLCIHDVDNEKCYREPQTAST